MKRFGNKLLCLILALVMVLGTFLTMDVAKAGKTQDVSFYWHHYDTGKGYYNPEDEGKPVSFAFFIEFKGTGEDGQVHTGLYSQLIYSGKIGEETRITVPVDEITDNKNNKYTDCTIYSIFVPIYSGNTIYATSGGDESLSYMLQQNMETKTQAKIAENSIILDEDRGAMPILYRATVTREEDGKEVTEIAKSRKNGKVIQKTLLFREGDVPVWSENRAESFYRAIFQSELEPFNPYSGKYKTFHLIAEFTGNRKTELDERYQLTVEGDDLKGWTLTLSSKIKEGSKEVTEDIPYSTVYEFDPSLKEGEVKLKQEGQLGKKITKTPYYYVLDGNGGEKVLKTFEEKTTIINPVDKIYLRGPIKGGNQPNPSDNNTDRIGGEDRIDTAGKVSSKFFEKADTVILARMDDYPDALTAGVLAKLMNAPILLTGTDQLDARVAGEIKRLGARQVLVVGGDNAVSQKAMDQAKAIAGSAERIGGKDRYETAALIAKQVVALSKSSSKAVVATGQDFADALAISSYAAREGQPILLVKPNQVPEATAKALADLKVEGVTIVGGDDAVSKALEAKLPKLEARVGGANRYETAALVASRFFENSDRAFLASGQNFADALVIGPVAGKLNAPVLLSKRDLLPAETKAQIKKAGYKKITIVGLDGAISKAVEDELK